MSEDVPNKVSPSHRPAPAGRLAWFHRNRWPLGIAGVLLLFVSANATMVTIAVRSHQSIAPDRDYYDRAVHFDEHKAAVQRTSEAGLAANIAVASVPLPAMPRLVDVTVHDREGKPVADLDGTLTAVRPSDSRLGNAGKLIAVPGEPGAYRLLLKLPVAGLWEFQLQARNKSGDTYQMVVRKDVVL